MDDVGPILLHLLGKDPVSQKSDDLFHSNLLIAGRCLASAPTLRQHHLRDDIIESLLTLFVQVSYSLLREQILEIFIPMRGRILALRLVELLQDEQLDYHLCGQITRALGEIGERSVVGDLLRLLQDPQLDRFVHLYIARALGKIGERSIVGDLLRLLQDGQLDRFLRREIARALGQVTEDLQTMKMCALLLAHTDVKVVADAIYSASWRMSSAGRGSYCPCEGCWGQRGCEVRSMERYDRCVWGDKWMRVLPESGISLF